MFISPQGAGFKHQLWNSVSSLIMCQRQCVFVLLEILLLFDILLRDLDWCFVTDHSFDEVIIVYSLCDIPLGGRRFERVNKHGTKMSKLDYFFGFTRRD